MLQFKQVTKTFVSGYDQWIFGPVDFEVKPNEFIAVLGKSGSGKSTLLHLAGGLAKPDSGQVLLNHEDLYSLKDKQIAKYRNQWIGFVFQDFHLLEDANVFTNVAMPLLIDGNLLQSDIEKKVKQILIEVDLADVIWRFPNELSGGQKQRVAIARAFVHNPKIVFADEPTGNLDEESGKNILNCLVQLNQIQKTILLCVTHDANIAKKANRIIKISDGKIRGD